jgi:hypothetical protein
LVKIQFYTMMHGQKTIKLDFSTFCNNHFLLTFRMSVRRDIFFAVHFMFAIHVEAMHAAPSDKAKLGIMFVPIFRRQSQICGFQSCLSQCPANYVLRRQILQNFPSHKNTDISGNVYEHFDFLTAGETPIAVGQPSEVLLTGSTTRG